MGGRNWSKYTDQNSRVSKRKDSWNAFRNNIINLVSLNVKGKPVV